MPQFARCANPACGVVLNLDRFPEGSPCHKCGERRRIPLPESPLQAAPQPRRAALLLWVLPLAGLVAAAFAGFLLLRGNDAPAPAEPVPAAASRVEPPAEPARPQATRQPEPPVRTVPPPARDAARAPREYTTYRKALDEQSFMREYDPNKPSDIQQYDGARLRLYLASYTLYVETDTPHAKFPGPVYHWGGRSEIVLPACAALETPLLCDVVGGRVYEIPEDALLEKEDALAVDKAAIAPLPRAGVRVQATVDVGFYHMVFVLIDPGAGGTPLLAGFGHTGQRLPVRPPAP